MAIIATPTVSPIERSVLWIGVVLLGALWAVPTSASDLFDGVDAYWEADYERALSVLEAVDSAGLNPGELQLYYKFLGATNFALGRSDQAELAFVELLRSEPDYQLDTREFSPDLADLLIKSRLSLARKIREEGLDAYRNGDYAMAAEKLESALLLDPDAPSTQEFLVLAKNNVVYQELSEKAEAQEAETDLEPCEPVRVWSRIRKGKTCEWVNYAGSLTLPVEVDRISLIYHEHHFGMGDCFTIKLEDESGQIVHEFKDPEGYFSRKEEPPAEARWQVIRFPEPRKIAKVSVKTSSAALRFGRAVKIMSDEMLLSLERECDDEFSGISASEPN